MNAGFRFTWAARGAAGLVALSLLLASGVAPARESAIFLGAIGIGKAKPEVEAELRSLLNAELASAEFSRAKIKPHGRYLLSATLVRLDSVQSAQSARATCVVSLAILRDGYTLHALLNGRATAEGANASEARTDALRAAVHSAMVRIPKAFG